MNKSEAREVLKLQTYKRMGADDLVARSLSALIRAAMTARSQKALLQQADDLGVRQHPEFVI